MENVTDRHSNPFDMRPPCARFVPGFGDANAHFHVVGDHPGVHGGADSGVPFTNEAGLRLQAALVEAGLLTRAGVPPEVGRTFLSYLHMCVPDTPDGEPTAAEYADLERFFDAELRAIVAHVLLPVGERATRHVLANYTARTWEPGTAMADLHATEIRGSGWLVVPIAEPATWSAEGREHERLVEGLEALQRTDYRRESDLGRFVAGNDPYLVR